MGFATTTVVLADWSQCLMSTLDSLFRPTKGTDSCEKIAIRANAWLRHESENGREIDVQRMSAEQVRRVFENLTVRPARIYLEALCAVQGVRLNDALVAAGYASGTPPPPATPLEAVTISLRGRSDLSELAKQQIIDFVNEVQSGEINPKE